MRAVRPKKIAVRMGHSNGSDSDFDEKWDGFVMLQSKSEKHTKAALPLGHFEHTAAIVGAKIRQLVAAH